MAAPAAPRDGQDDLAGPPGRPDQADGKVQTIDLPTLESPDLIKTATVSIVEENLAEARDVIDALLRKYGGTIADEKTMNDVKGRTETSTLVIRVPSRSFSGMLEDVKDQLNVKTSTTNTDDVHTEVIDVETRLANLRVSLARLRTFLRDATDLNAMLQFEQRITDVESQIGSLTAQREYLNDQTSMSTITLDLRTPTAPPPKPKEDDPLEDAGFFSGLEEGWNALKDVLIVAATVVGALIPFAVVALVLGGPAWLLLRRKRPPLVEQ